MSESLECLEAGPDCAGPVEYHTVGQRLRAFPRCEHHYARRLDRYEGSLEQEAESPCPPAWFDPLAAGERWDDDY